VDAFKGTIDQYIAQIDQLEGNLTQTQAHLQGQLGLAKTAIVILMTWVLLGQLVPLYLGWELINRR
jgi:hypothetical protein